MRTQKEAELAVVRWLTSGFSAWLSSNHYVFVCPLNIQQQYHIEPFLHVCLTIICVKVMYIGLLSLMYVCM